MKLLRPISFAVLIACGPAAFAQQTPPAPDNTSAQAAQTKDAVSEIPATPATPNIPVEPPSLIPPNILPGPNTSSLPQAPVSPDLQLLNQLFKQTTLGKVADEQRLHVQAAVLEVQIRNDPELHQLKAAAFAAPTDLERRHRLKTYFKVLYHKLRARAGTPEMESYLKGQEAAHELVLLQPRVRHDPDEKEAAELVRAQAGSTAAVLPAPRQAPVNDVLRSR